MKTKKQNQGQAILELSIFGSLIIFILGILLSFMQQMNDQQYTRMEAFRRALYQACTNNLGGTGAGSSVQYVLMQNRRHADSSNNFRKGSPQTFSASSSVSWAVPEISQEGEAARLTVVNVDGEERVASYREFVPKDLDRFDKKTGEERDKYLVFRLGDINTDSRLSFQEQTRKIEDPNSITNLRSSTLTQYLDTQVKYETLWKYKGSDDEDLEEEGDFFHPQRTYTESHASSWTTQF
ncbi:MAG: hypothetical protein ABIG46_00715 [Candidatus Omnitrophota bacterium]|nr:hypothetical protein [Candidatus Omnitrophota bacterium]